MIRMCKSGGGTVHLQFFDEKKKQMGKEQCRLPLHPRFYEALGRVNQVTPVETWPRSILRVMKNGSTINMSERVNLVCFLWGNGSNAEDILILLRHKLRDHSASLHVRSLLRDCASKSQRLFYYDVNLGECRDMMGCSYGEAIGYQAYRRMLNSWDRYVWARRETTLAMQKSFFAQRECLDAHAFFNVF